MFVLLNDGNSTICVNAARVKAVTEKEGGKSCLVTFSHTHEIEVQGNLAKVKTRLNGK